MSTGFTESVVEDAALAWLEALGYTVKHRPEHRPVGIQSSGIEVQQFAPDAGVA